MKCLSIHQPWATAILQLGKDIENRSWPTNYRGPLLIHASKSDASYKRQDDDEWMEQYSVRLPKWDELPKGAVIGIVDLCGCLNISGSPPPIEGMDRWAEGPYCWLLRNPRQFRIRFHIAAFRDCLKFQTS